MFQRLLDSSPLTARAQATPYRLHEPAKKIEKNCRPAARVNGNERTGSITGLDINRPSFCWARYQLFEKKGIFGFKKGNRKRQVLSHFERPTSHLVIIGRILTGCSRCLRMILFMICEDAVYTLANLEGKEDKHRDEFGNCISSHTSNSSTTLELKSPSGLSTQPCQEDSKRRLKCCFPRELVNFDLSHVTRSPPIGELIWVGRYNNNN